MIGLRRPNRRDAIEITQAERSYLDVVNRTQATIRFAPDGTILEANDNFLTAIGYKLNEIGGKHHSIFVDPDYAKSDAYKAFWRQLGAGEFLTDQFPRITKTGGTIWIQATYAPVFDAAGQVEGVVKIATNVTGRQTAIDALATGLQELSEGNLTHKISVSSLPDVALLGTAFNTAQERLSSSIPKVREISDTVESTAEQVQHASSELSGRTEQQAATLEETASSIEELTQSAKAAASTASDVSASAQNARSTAENGSVIVSQSVDAMELIEASSDKIKSIIAVIDDISFQTNLLALNAGVEAARAGEAGRGFAVVASEVRGLAQRAAEAANEVKQLINESSQQVTNGVRLVRKAGDELDGIVSAVSDITRNIGEIANGAVEQAASLSEISESVSQLDEVTQQNAALGEETSAASRTLAENAVALAHEVSTFSLDMRGSSFVKKRDWRFAA